MNRRTLIKSTAGVAGTMFLSRGGIIRPVNATVNRGVWASHFNGATYLRNDGFSSGRFPADPGSPYGVCSFIYRLASTTNVVCNILNTSNPSLTHSSLSIYLEPTAGIKHGTYRYRLNVALSDAAVYATTPMGSVPNDGNYHIIQAAWDLTNVNNPITCTVDLVTQSNGLPRGNNGNVAYYTQNGQNLSYSVGSVAYTGGTRPYYLGDLAEMYLYAGNFIDITNPSNQAGFWDHTNNQPPSWIDISSDGRNAIPGLIPNLYFSGPGGIFPLTSKNGQSDGTSLVFDVADQDNFYLAAGQLQTPTTDPWGNIGV